ncbi:MAG: hypothetical protein PHD82_15755 [Candidatus Riflebacteria bacterium]|nr:hypothetical protein [Candidatus Riflebacteria bacterium]
MIEAIPSPFKARLFSAWGFVFRALLIIFVFGLLHLLGLREYTSFISGTTSGNYHDLLGMTYFLFYALAVFVAPVFLLASAFMAIVSHFFASKQADNG